MSLVVVTTNHHTGEKSHCFRVGEELPRLNEVIELQAAGAELAKIARLFANPNAYGPDGRLTQLASYTIPMIPSASTMVWAGDIAATIYKNLCRVDF